MFFFCCKGDLGNQTFNTALLFLTQWHVDVSFHSLALSGACYYEIHSSEWKYETEIWKLLCKKIKWVIIIKCRRQRFWADTKCEIPIKSHWKFLYRIQRRTYSRGGNTCKLLSMLKFYCKCVIVSGRLVTVASFCSLNSNIFLLRWFWSSTF